MSIINTIVESVKAAATAVYEYETERPGWFDRRSRIEQQRDLMMINPLATAAQIVTVSRGAIDAGHATVAVTKATVNATIGATKAVANGATKVASVVDETVTKGYFSDKVSRLKNWVAARRLQAKGATPAEAAAVVKQQEKLRKAADLLAESPKAAMDIVAEVIDVVIPDEPAATGTDGK